MLKGRPRNCAAFIKQLTKRPKLCLSKDEEISKTIKLWYEEISTTMANYLITTALTLGPTINPEIAIIEFFVFELFIKQIICMPLNFFNLEFFPPSRRIPLPLLSM